MTALPAEQRSEHLPNSFAEKAGAFAVLTAAGSGTRLGAAHPKALVQLAGSPLVHWAAEGLAAAGVKATAITAPPGHEDEIAALFSAGYCAQMRVHVVSGGASRQASVALGLAALAKQYLAETGCEIPADTVVLVCDAARCLTPTSLISRVQATVEAGHPAVIPALPVTDTVKEVAPQVQGIKSQAAQTGAPTVAQTKTAIPGQSSRPEPVEQVIGTPQRRYLRAVQTPQGFTWEVLTRAHQAGAHLAATEELAASDDAALVEAIGEPVVMIAGAELALKITHPSDLVLAQFLGEQAAVFS